MKTPEPSIPLESFMQPQKTEPEEIAAQVVGRYMPTSKAENPRGYYLANDISDVIAAERCKARALAEALRKTTATVAALYQWLEQVEAAGGATNLNGIAKCHAMLTSMRKNADRTEKLVMAPARAALAAYDAEAK